MDRSIPSLPTEVLEKILLSLSYEEVDKLRAVSRDFNSTGITILKKGYKAAREEVGRLQSTPRRYWMVKLPHTCQELTNVFAPYIEMKLSCMPGKVIDAVFSVISVISVIRCMQDKGALPSKVVGRENYARALKNELATRLAEQEKELAEMRSMVNLLNLSANATKVTQGQMGPESKEGLLTPDHHEDLSEEGLGVVPRLVEVGASPPVSPAPDL